MVLNREARIIHANRILASFCSVRLGQGKQQLVMSWPGHKKVYRFAARLRGQGDWPQFGKHSFPFGGTGTQALAQIIRYVRNLPRLPIGTWEYWASETVQLCRPETLELLRAANYDDIKSTCCVLCGTVATHMKGLDWWSLDRVVGPCCSFGVCREVRRAN